MCKKNFQKTITINNVYNFSFLGAALEVGRPAAMQVIARDRRRTTSSILAEWPAILNSPEWGQSEL